MTARYLAVVILALVGLAGCASGPIKDITRVFEAKGEPQLQAGIKLYEDGKYAQAQKNFESALNTGLSNAGKVSAHKYLAFIHCATKRERQCRGHFATALELDPSFELDAAEAGHPMWGPVFRSVKSRR
ncbi:MAG TPA: TssQ family T6SS-associated lipoprotein [Burkholderiales bacterium]|nr:TssQ family T6SS-associated lipoprotein [Burkholderiales bacterium]